MVVCLIEYVEQVNEMPRQANGKPFPVRLLIKNNTSQKIFIEELIDACHPSKQTIYGLNLSEIKKAKYRVNKELLPGSEYYVEYLIYNDEEIEKEFSLTPKFKIRIGSRTKLIECTRKPQYAPMAILNIILDKKSYHSLKFILCVPQVLNTTHIPAIITNDWKTKTISEFISNIRSQIKLAPRFHQNFTVNSDNLVGIGNELMCIFNLDSLHDALSENNVKYLLIRSDMHLIPWELISEGKEMWGLKYGVSRWYLEKPLKLSQRKLAIDNKIRFLVIASDFNLEIIKAYNKYGDDFIKYVDASNVQSLKDLWRDSDKGKLYPQNELKNFFSLYKEYKELIELKVIKIGINRIEVLKNGNLVRDMNIDVQALTSNPIEKRKGRERIRSRPWNEHAKAIKEIIIKKNLIPSEFDIIHFSGENAEIESSNTYAFLVSPIPKSVYQITPRFFDELTNGKTLNENEKTKLTFLNMCNAAADAFLNPEKNYQSFVDSILKISLNVIAPFNEIPNIAAPLFSGIFYYALIKDLAENGETRPISEILRDSKKHYIKLVSESYPELKEDPNWAWYVHYGDPLNKFLRK